VTWSLVPYTLCTLLHDCSDENGGSNKSGEAGEGKDVGNLLAADTGDGDTGGQGPSVGGDAGNANPLTSDVVEHILSGNINQKGKAVGYHWEGDPNARGEVVPGTRTSPDARGVYEAKVTIDGVPKKGISSFFPQSMSAQDVIDSIMEAYNNRTYLEGNSGSATYAGETSTGMVVQMFIDPSTSQIRSAFPWYEPGFP
jgi:hypothetical protein